MLLLRSWLYGLFFDDQFGELAAYLPVSGTFSTYGSRYVDEAFGFALGWNYWYNWAATVAVDLVAVQLVLLFWFPEMTPLTKCLFSALFLGIIFLLNYISVKGLGEAEFWFAMIKVIAVICFITIGILMIVGILKS